MPPAGVKKGTQARASVRAHQGLPEGAGTLRGKGRGDRGAHGQQGAGAARRVEDRLARPRPRTRSPRASAEGSAQGTKREKGRTRDQLYAEARHKGVKGRSSMNKAQLERAVGR